MIGVRSPFDDQYDGSRLFVWLADMCGLSVDVINFLICQISALFLASLFRSLLHPSRASIASRHAFGLGVGLCFGYFFFGKQAIHIAGLPALCYIVIRTQDPQIVQRLVLVVAMGYLSCIHMYRLYYDYGSTTIDITGPLMMITQKITTLAFSLHDGIARDPAALSQLQRGQAVRRIPSLLEYFAFCLHFQGLMAGPIVMFGDYMRFIEGTNLRPHSAPLAAAVDGSQPPLLGGEIVREPSPTRTVVQKMLGSVLCAFVFMKFSKVYPIKNIKEADFVDGVGFLGKMWFVMNATMFVRFKFYHAWLMGDAICNNSGLGFNGYDAQGRAKWDLCSNIDILGFEFATNFRYSINSWNMSTNRWLRHVVYERVPKRYGTMLTFGLSAVWHGFYPGYYMTFASGALMVMAARVARKHIRYHFQETSGSRQMYDVITVLVTRVFMAYATFPFVVLEFKASVNMYLSVYMCLHLIAVVSIVAMPRLLRAAPANGTDRKHQVTGSYCTAVYKSNTTPSSNHTNNGHKKTAGGWSLTAPTTAHCDISNSRSGETEPFDGRHLFTHMEQPQQATQQQQHSSPHQRHFVAGNGNDYCG